MKKITVILMILCLSLLFAGCGSLNFGKKDHSLKDKKGKEESYNKEENTESFAGEEYSEEDSYSENEEKSYSEDDSGNVSLKTSKNSKERDWSKRSIGSGDDLDEAEEYNSNDEDSDRLYQDEPVGDARNDGNLSNKELRFFEKELNSILFPLKKIKHSLRIEQFPNY